MQYKYNSLWKKLYNYSMNNGKKYVCEKIYLKSLKIIQKKTKKNHKSLIQSSIINVAPVIQLKQIKKKKRKTVKEFPFTLNKKNRIAYSIKTILYSLNQNNSNKIVNKFSQEILMSFQNNSEILKLKEIKHNVALTKKKYVFFRWFC